MFWLFWLEFQTLIRRINYNCCLSALINAQNSCDNPKKYCGEIIIPARGMPLRL
jgi:hypothetical protein